MSMPETNNQPIVNISPQGGEDSPAVLAYRVGKLEEIVHDGFQQLYDKLDLMNSVFATHKDMSAAKAQTQEEHRAIYKEIGYVKAQIKSLKQRNWVQNTLSAILGAVLALLITYAINGILY